MVRQGKDAKGVSWALGAQRKGRGEEKGRIEKGRGAG